MYDDVCEWSYRHGGLTLLIDEVYDIIAGNPEARGLRRALKLGRQRDLRVICCTQRPSRIPLDILSESDHAMVFSLRMRDDRKRMAEIMGEGVENPPPVDYAYWYTGPKTREPGLYSLKYGG
jgi:hypothetical protein